VSFRRSWSLPPSPSWRPFPSPRTGRWTGRPSRRRRGGAGQEGAGPVPRTSPSRARPGRQGPGPRASRGMATPVPPTPGRREGLGDLERPPGVGGGGAGRQLLRPGGHSLLTVQVHGRIREAFRQELRITDLLPVSHRPDPLPLPGPRGVRRRRRRNPSPVPWTGEPCAGRLSVAEPVGVRDESLEGAPGFRNRHRRGGNGLRCPAPGTSGSTGRTSGEGWSPSAPGRRRSWSGPESLAPSWTTPRT
jgi:hypothetical protein